MFDFMHSKRVLFLNILTIVGLSLAFLDAFRKSLIPAGFGDSSGIDVLSFIIALGAWSIVILFCRYVADILYSIKAKK